jgi:hypothetical protein
MRVWLVVCVLFGLAPAAAGADDTLWLCHLPIAPRGAALSVSADSYRVQSGREVLAEGRVTRQGQVLHIASGPLAADFQSITINLDGSDDWRDWRITLEGPANSVTCNHMPVVTDEMHRRARFPRLGIVTPG